LVKILDAEGFPAMCDAAHNCPACILAVLRVRREASDDGRNVWNYDKAKREWWDKMYYEDPSY
jgi:hypothetical protein